MIRHRSQSIIGDIPSDWKARPLYSLLTDDLSGDWGDDEGEVTLSVLRSTNFSESGNMDVSDVARRAFSEAKAAQLQVQVNDILVERSGGGPIISNFASILFDSHISSAEGLPSPYS